MFCCDELAWLLVFLALVTMVDMNDRMASLPTFCDEAEFCEQAADSAIISFGSESLASVSSRKMQSSSSLLFRRVALFLASLLVDAAATVCADGICEEL